MINSLRKKCSEAGFDLCEHIHTRWYNDLIETEGHVERGTLSKLPEPAPTLCENDDEDINEIDGSIVRYNAVLIGNTKTIWPKFINWLEIKYHEHLKKNHQQAKDCEEIALNQIVDEHPFDTFVSESLQDVLKCSCGSATTFVQTQQQHPQQSNGATATSSPACSSYEIFWSNGKRDKISMNETCTTTTREKYDEKKEPSSCTSTSGSSSFLVSMQRMAKLSGKYWQDDEGTKLCVHPLFGTWTAFRAVVVFYTNNDDSSLHHDMNIVVPNVPPPCPCPVIQEDIELAKKVMKFALAQSSANNSSNVAGDNGDSNNDTIALMSYSDSNTTRSAGSGSQALLCQYLHNTVTRGSEWSKVPMSMRPWIQLRDCISVGRDVYKYEDDQLLYHYTKDPDILRRNLICSSSNAERK
mmetsp:Transcript_6704/g.9946  ORF Transcript_6704/g.9946 Transcript_6704/m.9946 type:complete len:411 (+) Transcript_6704:49-1281(+)